MQAAKDAYDTADPAVQAFVSDDAKNELEEATKCYEKDTVFESGTGVYRVLSNGDVTYLKPLHPEDTYFQVPNDVVCPHGFSFKVVKISINAFKGCANVTKIWVGKNIVTIGAYAFKGATNLKTLIIRTQAIDVEEKIANAFVGAGKAEGKKFTVQVWDKMISKYEPMFRGAGGLSDNAKIVALS